MNNSLLQQEIIKNILAEDLELKLEMAYDIQRIYDKIDDKSEKVIQHLILCFVFGKISPTTINHWKGDLYSILHQTYKVRGTNKYPTEKQLRDNCLNWSDTLLETLDASISGLAHRKKLDIPEYDVKILYNKIISYFKWLFKEFSIKGYVTDTEVFAEIDNLLQK